ncbi:hypothetical protein [Scopulibacillus cellulosilyticus]|uniref:Uncharacterized protein n=1 Tax=Scopulibacillus cellulosilyticus TaxID=2665665 RepID=A0ABW2PYR0_9BACL
MNKKKCIKGGKNMQHIGLRFSKESNQLSGKRNVHRSPIPSTYIKKARRDINNAKASLTRPSTDIMELFGVFGEDPSGKSFEEIREEAKEKYYAWKKQEGKF